MLSRSRCSKNGHSHDGDSAGDQGTCLPMKSGPPLGYDSIHWVSEDCWLIWQVQIQIKQRSSAPSICRQNIKDEIKFVHVTTGRTVILKGINSWVNILGFKFHLFLCVKCSVFFLRFEILSSTSECPVRLVALKFLSSNTNVCVSY